MKIINKRVVVTKIKHQRGAALLIAVVVLSSIAVFFLIGKHGAPVSHKLERQESRVAALAEAKKALIAYAVNYISNGNDGEFGFLPCPDVDENTFVDEGGSHGVCGATDVSSIGRFPWRTLELPPLKDDANECLWYSVSGSYKSEPKTAMLNEDTNGLLEIFDAQGNSMHGASAEDRVVAVIIAPGKPLAGQARGGFIDTDEGTRICGGNYIAANYLETDLTADAGAGVDNSVVNNVANSVSKFIKAGTNTAVNDRIAIITQGDIWLAVKRRKDFLSSLRATTDEMARCVTDYGNAIPAQPHYLPWPATIDLGGVSDYHLDANYSDQIPVPATGLLGRLADDVTASETALPNTTYTAGGAGTVQVCRQQCQSDFLACRQACPNGNGRRACRDACVVQRVTCRAACIGGGTTAATAKGINSIITNCTGISAGNLSFWRNWKDHFFYVVSGSYTPDSPNVGCAGGNCVSVAGNPYAGIVMFSGERLAGINRNAPPPVTDPDDKANIANYLEGQNAINFPDVTGSSAYETNAAPAGNDYMVCISEGATLSASPCP